MSPLTIDFLSPTLRYRFQHASLKKELLARAMGKHPRDNPVIIDATAGLGRDSMLLAVLGFKVTMIERSPVLYDLLKDALARAADDKTLSEACARLELILADSVDWLRSPACIEQKKPDIIYLDPMFPERKKSASVKKEMVSLQELLGKDDNVQDLFSAAMACGANRVVVKRPRLSPNIVCAPGPAFTLSGKSSRFDVYLNPR